MKLKGILALFILSATVEAYTWLPSLLQPVMFTLGALFTANDLDIDPIFDGMRDLLASKKQNVNKFTNDDYDLEKDLERNHPEAVESIKRVYKEKYKHLPKEEIQKKIDEDIALLERLEDEVRAEG